MREIEICKSKSDLTERAAEIFAESSAAAIAESGRFTVALSGGSTPASLYKLLASETFRTQLDLPNIYFFFGDERIVPADSPDSNFRMANETMLSPLGAPSENIFRWKTEFGEAAAADYESTLIKFFGLTETEPSPLRDWPRFDLVLLGMGTDGHTASLFPNSPALKEISRHTAVNEVAALSTKRLTLTFPVLNAAAAAMFLVTGSEKADVVKNVLEGEFRPDDLPAQFVEPDDGRLIWLLDADAAAMLDH